MKARVKYHIIYRHRTEHPAAVMCEFFAVSRSGCYAFVHRLGRPEKDAALAGLIAQQRERSFRTYGCRRMWLWLKSRNIFRNPKTVLRIMQKYDLLSEIRRRRKWQQMGQQLHNGQRFQYTLQAYGITPSMLRRGNPYNNAMAENFFSILKTECIYRHKPATFSKGNEMIDRYIHFSNHERIQLKTGEALLARRLSA